MLFHPLHGPFPSLLGPVKKNPWEGPTLRLRADSATVQNRHVAEQMAPLYPFAN